MIGKISQYDFHASVTRQKRPFLSNDCALSHILNVTMVLFFLFSITYFSIQILNEKCTFVHVFAVKVLAVVNKMCRKTCTSTSTMPFCKNSPTTLDRIVIFTSYLVCLIKQKSSMATSNFSFFLI